MRRRTLLKVGGIGAVALALLDGGLSVFHEPAWRGDRLTAAGRRVLNAVARAVLDGSLPVDIDLQQAALSAHLDRLEATLRGFPAAMQREAAELLALLATPLGRLALAGLTTEWRHADPGQVQASLQAMRTSRISVRQQAFHALRDLTHAAYFADPATWPQLGYPGPTKIA